MMVTIMGAVGNAILDLILIFGFGLELQGAAWASVAARAAIGTTALVPIVRFYGGFGRPNLASIPPDLRPVLIIAFPAILTQLATPIGQAYVTRQMASFGEDAVAGMAIVGPLTPVAFAIIFALSGAIGPIIGQNFGAGKADRVRAAFRDGVLFTAVVVVVVSALLFAARPLLVMLFELDGQTQTLVFLFAGPLSLLWFDLCVQCCLQQHGVPVLFHDCELGASHGGHHSVRDGGFGVVRGQRCVDWSGRWRDCICGHCDHRRAADYAIRWRNGGRCGWHRQAHLRLDAP